MADEAHTSSQTSSYRWGIGDAAHLLAKCAYLQENIPAAMEHAAQALEVRSHLIIKVNCRAVCKFGWDGNQLQLMILRPHRDISLIIKWFLNQQDRDQVAQLAQQVQEVTHQNVEMAFVDQGYTDDKAE